MKTCSFFFKYYALFQAPTMFDSTKGALLVAPSLSNSSCWLNGKGWPSTLPAAADILKALFIFTLSMAIVFGNLVLICVLNNRRYTKYIDNQVCVLENYIKLRRRLLFSLIIRNLEKLVVNNLPGIVWYYINPNKPTQS